MTTVTISLPDALIRFINAQAANKGYGDASEYILSLVHEAQDREADARLEALVLEGLASGDPIPVDENFWSDLRKKRRNVLKRGRREPEAGQMKLSVRPSARTDVRNQIEYYLELGLPHVADRFELAVDRPSVPQLNV